MEINERIRNLSATHLPDDLLQLLSHARKASVKKQDMRANAMLNIIEKECGRRGIKIRLYIYQTPQATILNVRI